MAEISAKDMSSILGLTVARVGQLAKDGIITRQEDGMYEISAITEYIQWLRRPSGKTGKDYQKLLEKEKYREKKRQNDVEEGLLAPVGVLQDALEKGSRQVVAELESLPLLIKRNWPEVSGDQVQLIKKSIAQCRNSIADLELDFDS